MPMVENACATQINQDACFMQYYLSRSSWKILWRFLVPPPKAGLCVCVCVMNACRMSEHISEKPLKSNWLHAMGCTTNISSNSGSRR